MASRKKRRRCAVLFGFDLKDKENTGYLAFEDGKCSITQDRAAAKEFSLSAEPGKGTPADWCEFFKTEPEVANWRFHPIVLLKEAP